MNNNSIMETDHAYRKRITNLEGWISIVVNMFLFILKYWAGIVSGSLALIADAWHTLSDSLSSIFVIVSAKLSFRKPDESHPFGHGRFELISSIFIGVLLILVSIGFMKQGYERFIHREAATYGAVAIWVTAFSILLKEALAQYAFWGFRKTNSNTLKADGWHHRSDAISSVIILIGIFFGRKIWWIDAVLGIIVAIFILYTAIVIIKQSISGILGEAASPELIDKVKKIAYLTAKQEIYLHHIHFHNYELHREITFHICLPSLMTIKEAHEITTAIENSIRIELNIEATIHIDPFKHVPHDLTND
jgi:cation diffusion facilitator family transporter